MSALSLPKRCSALARPRALLLAALAAAAAIVPLFLDPQGYWVRVLTLTLIFAALGQAWNIVGGLANQISLGHAAYFGVGAYASTILLINFGLSPWIGLFVGMALAVVVALVLSVPTFRLKGHYFALATLAAGEALRVIANSWQGVTGGPVGLSVPFMPDSFWMMSYGAPRPFYWIALAALVLVTLVFWWIKSSALGYRLRAVKENEQAAEVVGVNTFRAKLWASLVSAAATAAIGVVYVQFTYFFDPDAVFGVATVSVRLALVAIVGGIGTVIGPVVGALVVVPLEELVNAALQGQVAGLSAFVYGAILIAVILVEPRGLVALFGRLRRGLGRRPGGAGEAGR
ncbi:amino acid/amide ABC transporter membrane protein 2, HAAT family [Tistlia consotensis]|uniref:Amino acid/amide ABC transporter membrane protein 2, HAAT family n=1 Tax=Tistlia consotensis USBA 355 TaxID=560819 RepID=A0A1Y6CN17_9PROT|nr:branched-chain amino acid ABC transporter permease [Tistlia consotensis]SMF65507.1 amino acid/amide ABC transporter membrane protein 2, HAAT family [Tistlia consotensis USBA 355]SNS03672.1 amino acid/amide ABC transporter membrane protein 2, HAAT family [Tistlia consotensis]